MTTKRKIGEFDLDKLHDYRSDEEIIIDATLIYDGENTFSNTPARFLQDGLKCFKSPGIRCCLAVWRNGLCAYVYYPHTQGQPTGDAVVTAFYQALALSVFRENEEGTWLWA